MFNCEKPQILRYFYESYNVSDLFIPKPFQKSDGDIVNASVRPIVMLSPPKLLGGI